MKKYQLSTCFVLFMMLNVIFAGSVQAWQGMATPKLHVEGRFLKDPSGKNVVLHGWMQPTSSYFNGRFYSDPRTFTPEDCAEALNVYKSVVDLLSNPEPLFGYDHGWYNSFVRIWPPSDGWNGDGTVDEELQDRAWHNMYIPYVEYCRERGIYVVFVGNAPDGGEFMGAQYKSNLIAYWTRICNTYPEIKNADNVMFEICNEPVSIESELGNGDWGSVSDAHDRAVQTYFQDIVDAIRATGFDNVIWVPGLIWQDRLMNFAKYPISGGNIGYAGHMYPFGANNVDEINNRFVNSGWKACSDLYPVIVTEGSWHTMDEDQGIRTGTTEVFGVTVKNFYETQGNISWFCGMTEELIGGMEGGINNFTYPEINCGKAGFEWWPTYAWMAPTDRPMGLNATIITENQVNLSWTGVPEATSYNIKRSIVSGGPYTVISSDITGVSFIDTDVSSGQPYFYVVSANLPHGESPDSNESLSTGLQLYLNFNESEGTTAYDSTGNSWDGTLANGPQWDTGIFGNAVELDGSDDYISLPSGVVDGMTDFTICTWVYLDTISGWSRVFDFGSGSNVNMFLTPRNSITGAVRFAITNSGSGDEQRITGSNELPSGEWAHVAVSLRGSTGVLYVNGSEVGRNSAMTLTPSSLGLTSQNYIGRSQYQDPYLDGMVDDFRIYPIALSAESIKTLYNENIPVEAPSYPEWLNATVVSNSRIDLSWDDVPEAANYNIKYSLADGGPYALLASLGTTTISDTELLESTTYYYVVTALNSAGESLNSQQAEAVTLNAQPQPPAGLSATDGNGLVSLNWQANTEEDLAGYNVYRSATSNGGYMLLNESLLETASFIDSSAIDYNMYYYVVTAVDEFGLESIYSEEVELLPIDDFDAVLNGVGFENSLEGWENVTGVDTHDWTRDSGGTTTPNTGPNAGANNSTWYLYIETSPGGAGKSGNTAIFESQEVNGYNRVLIFDYHMFGVNIGSLYVDVYDGIWHDAVWSLSGQQQSSSVDNYKQALVDLRQYGGPVKIRFRAVAAGGSQGDIAIDDIEVLGRELYGDMNGDNILNVEDLIGFANIWINVNCELDLDGDCVITLHEFAEFAENWLNENSN